MAAYAVAPLRLTSRLELFLSADGLANKDAISKSDPYAVVFMSVISASGAPAWHEVGRTEVLWDTLSPRWTAQIGLDYHFEEVQPLRIEVWDKDSGDVDDSLGFVELPLGRVMGAPRQKMVLPLPTKGTLTLRASEQQGSSDDLRMQIRCTSLERKDWFGSSDPFVVFSRVLKGGGEREREDMQRVWCSTVIKNNLNPKFPEAYVRLQALCNGDEGAPILVEVWDWNSSGSHELIGGFRTCYGEMRAEVPFELINEAKKAKKKGYKNSGTLTFTVLERIRRPSLLEYIRGGLQVSVRGAGVGVSGARSPVRGCG